MSRTRPLAFQIILHNFPKSLMEMCFIRHQKWILSQSKKSTLYTVVIALSTMLSPMLIWLEQVLDNHSKQRLFGHSKYVSHHSVCFCTLSSSHACIAATIKAVTFMKSYHQCSPAFIFLSVRLSNHLSISIITGPYQSSPSINILYVGILTKLQQSLKLLILNIGMAYFS